MEQKERLKIKTISKDVLSDRITPVALYLKLRDVYPGALLLESGDYHGAGNSLSYLCFNPIAGFMVENGQVKRFVNSTRAFLRK